MLLFTIIISVFSTAAFSQIQTIIPCPEDSAYLTGFDFYLSNPDIMYAVYYQQGVFKSNNRGINWNHTSSLDGFTRVVVNPDQPDIAYALKGG